MQEIIEKAIEGGWEGTDEYGGEYTMEDFLYSKEKVLLDPLFWQCLGKACGWKWCDYNCPKEPCNHKQGDWLFHALEFHRINFKEGFDIAVEYLQDLIK